MLTAKLDVVAARRFLERAINLIGVLKQTTIDKSGANTATIESSQADAGADIERRRIKSLNSLIEQDQIKRTVRPMLRSKSLWPMSSILTGVETMHMIRRRQLDGPTTTALSAAVQFHCLPF